MVPIFDRSRIMASNGFCLSDPTSLIFRAALSVSLFLVVILLCVTNVFSFLTYCYAKKNVLEENVEIKRAVARNLYYFTISSIFTLIYNGGPALSSPIKLAISEKGIIPTVIVYYIFQVLIAKFS